jgi:hypothetical protein
MVKEAIVYLMGYCYKFFDGFSLALYCMNYIELKKPRSNTFKSREFGG